MSKGSRFYLVKNRQNAFRKERTKTPMRVVMRIANDYKNGCWFHSLHRTDLRIFSNPL